MAPVTAMQRGPRRGERRQANPERLQRRLDFLRSRDAQDPRIRRLERRLERAGGAPVDQAADVPFGQMSPQQQMETLGTGIGTGIQQYLGQMQQQGAFQPGDYNQSYQQAYQNVMGQFELQNRPQFEREQQAVEAQIAQRGIDPTGSQAQQLRDQIYQRQEQARQQAMYSAEQLGRNLQQQQFQQDLTTYQVPTAQLQALQGYYSGQLGTLEAQRQREFEADQARRQRELQRELSARGGGGADPFALMAAEYGYKRDLMFDQLAAAGANQPRQPGLGTAIAGGLAQGVSTGLTYGLAR
jgi:hypothetical protein